MAEYTHSSTLRYQYTRKIYLVPRMCLVHRSTRGDERGFKILQQERCIKATPTPHSAGRKAYQVERRGVQKRRLHRMALLTDLGAATATLVSAETPIQNLPCMQASQLGVGALLDLQRGS